MEDSVWTPRVVEELLFRQYIKNEDVSRLLPPPPKVTNENILERYDQATRILFSYVRNGPMTALSSQNVNTTAGKHFGLTPSKPFANNRTPNLKASSFDAQHRVQAQALTPKQSCAPSIAKLPPSPPPPQLKRSKLDWPDSVPTNNMLKSNSRSKVASLTAKRVAAQQVMDPDLIFTQNAGELPLNVIFANYPKALKSVSIARNASGDWRTDTFTLEEEGLYKKDMGFEFCGPSQCTYGRGALYQTEDHHI